MRNFWEPLRRYLDNIVSSKAIYIILLLIIFAQCSKEGNSIQNPNDFRIDVKLMPLSKAYAKNSINTSVFRVNSICSDERCQIVSYFDEDGYVTFAVRPVGVSAWNIIKSDFQCNCVDAHNGIAVELDGYGFIHIVYDQHSNGLTYRKSLAPYSFQFGEIQNMIDIESETYVTYPEFHRKKNGNLIFMYRAGGSGNGDLVINEYNLKSGKWERIQGKLIDGEGERNAYWQSFFTNDDMYISWVWRESPNVESNHDMCFAYSKDGCMSWLDSKSQAYTVPILEETADIIWNIPENSELINQTSMCVDAIGNPYIATYWCEQNDSIPQYKVISKKGEKWVVENVLHRKTPFSLSGNGTKRIPIARPKIFIDKNNRGFFLFRDIERNEVVSLAYCDDISKPSWNVMDLTDFTVGAWEPTIDDEMWKTNNILDIYVQKSYQGDGEVNIDTDGELAYILEVCIN